MTVREIEAKYGLIKDCISSLDLLSSEEKLELIMNCVFGKGRRKNCYSIFIIEHLYDADEFCVDAAELCRVSLQTVKGAYWTRRRRLFTANNALALSGAEAVSIVLRSLGCRFAVAYPGTSELSLCEAINRCPGFELINGRGDTESAFCTAGANLVDDGKCICILHGARGLTNALGALADSRRNEIGSLVLVGMPSMASECYLPPHGETRLIEGLAGFVKEGIDYRPEHLNKHEAVEWLKRLKECYFKAFEGTKGPVVFGIPQNMSEEYWIPYEVLAQHFLLKPESQDMDSSLESSLRIDEARGLLWESRNPCILLDDYAFKKPIKQKIISFSTKYELPVFQVMYQRGPMLFEQVLERQGEFIMGHYDSKCPEHTAYFNTIDLLITLEDRNMYKRVVGELPPCRKIVITSNISMTMKNRYIANDDVVLVGDVEKIIDELFIGMPKLCQNKQNICLLKSSRFQKACDNDFLWDSIATAIGRFLNKQQKPFVLDDSQMFGGFLAKWYKRFPNNTQVFGDHGAFVGAGISYAAGVALARREADGFVVATLGDQAFTNGLQGLICVSENNLKVLYIVCNNGKSVSLMKQESYNEQGDLAANYMDNGLNVFLSNAQKLDYCRIAAAVGISNSRFVFGNVTKENYEKVLAELEEVFESIYSRGEPHLLELVISPERLNWQGVWNLVGFDQRGEENEGIL